MKRRIIQIDEALCNGCGLCVDACHEGALALVGGKAKLTRDDYCDGLGNCLPACPTGAITFVEREAAQYDEEAVKANQLKKKALKCGCPGSSARSLTRTGEEAPAAADAAVSELRQWPVQIQLVPENASYFNGAKLLVAADCAAYARANFHAEFIRGHITLIGCPKLDETEYSEKLTRILTNNTITALTVVRMEVPCCGGIEQAAAAALKNSGRHIPWRVVTIGIGGAIVHIHSENT